MCWVICNATTWGITPNPTLVGRTIALLHKSRLRAPPTLSEAIPNTWCSAESRLADSRCRMRTRSISRQLQSSSASDRITLKGQSKVWIFFVLRTRYSNLLASWHTIWFQAPDQDSLMQRPGPTTKSADRIDLPSSSHSFRISRYHLTFNACYRLLAVEFKLIRLIHPDKST
jgi:hypothetical protein